ncbi:MAG: AI-2E family transporter [Desulfobacteraceae bacterium]|nr:MAG: AI-2E family transporter [Desulfobacteraceae bacterium]
MGERTIIDVSTSSIVRFFAVLLGIILLYYLRDIVVVLLFAVVLASAMEPAIRWFQRHKIPRILGTVIIFLSVVAIFVAAVYLVVPLVSEDLQGFTLTYPI